MTTTAPSIVAVGDLAGMPRSQREAYFAGLPGDTAAQQRAAYRAFTRRQNQHYLDACYPKTAVCPPASGAATTWNYTNGPMVFYAPVADGAFIKELLITLNLTVTLAAGTAAVYGAAPTAPYSLFDYFKVELNNEQIVVRPAIYKYLNLLRGYNRSAPAATAGPHDATIDAQINTGTPTAVGANTWNLAFRVPLNLGHRKSPAGMLPSMSDSTRAKITLVGAALTLGVDPLTNAVFANGGTGNAVTSVTGTVKCEAIYLDGSTYWNDRKLRLFLDEEPTIQGIQDLTLSSLLAGTRQRQKISTLRQHYYVLSFLIDGQAAGKFSTLANIQRLALNKDQVGQNNFWAVGVGTDQSVNNYFENLRDTFGQDWDIGVVLWTYAPQNGAQNPGNNDGIRVLNMQPGGFVNVTHEYQVAAVGAAAGSQPRVETFLISMANEGLLQVRS